MRPRCGITLVESLVVVGILGAALGLLLPAIMQVRAASLRMQSMNNLKNLVLSVHDFASERAGRLPRLMGNEKPGASFHTTLLPYLEEGRAYAKAVEDGSRTNSSNELFRVFLSPADPTVGGLRGKGMSSYPVNAFLLSVNRASASLAHTFTDGTSQTILFAEHYALNYNEVDKRVTQFSWFLNNVEPPDMIQDITIVARRATFADVAAKDVCPITKALPPQSVPSIDGLTFQVRPTAVAFDPRVAQTPHSSGMLIAMADGTVRSVAPKIAENVYWALVTPAGGEAIGNDW